MSIEEKTIKKKQIAHSSLNDALDAALNKQTKCYSNSLDATGQSVL